MGNRSTLVSILDVGWFTARCVASAVMKQPLVYGLWTAVFAVAGGMMLFLVTTCSGSGLTV
jgi:hypothetical protein